jgi:hypothetical protein
MRVKRMGYEGRVLPVLGCQGAPIPGLTILYQLLI